MQDVGDNISIIIRCKNEEQWIGYAIQSCLDHIKKPEILIVDNMSTDNSVFVCKQFCFDNIIVEHVCDYSPGSSLNNAVNIINKKYTLILSAHAEITMFNMNCIKKYLSNSKCVAIFGHQTPIYRGKKINPRYIWSHFKENVITNMYSVMEDRYFFHNAFALYDTEFLKSCPFNEKLQGKEDRYWAKNVIDNMKKNIIYTPQMKCKHHWTPNGNTWKFGE